MTNTAPAPNVRPAMNPAIVVAGGGAGGGGGSGKGKGSGSDKIGAGNGTGEGDPEGGGKDANGCGSGASGGCTNCGSQISRGDPFDVVTGEVYTAPKEDLFLPGTFALKLIRKYMSSCCNLDLGLGWGWTHTLGWSLVREDGNLIIQTGDGRTVKLPDPEGETGEYSDGVWSVLKTKEFYAVDPGNEFVHLFSRPEGSREHLVLTHVVYRNRGHLLLRYDRGLLCSVTDTVGRTVRLHRTPEGRISFVDVPDERGNTITFARFEYDTLGHLIAATDAEGAVTRYRYNENHLLTRLEHPNGVTFHFVYDQQGRCIETWGAGSVEPDPALSENVPKVLSDSQIRAKGIYHCRADYLDDEYVEVIDSIRLQRFFAGPHGQIAKAVGARGQVTERTFDVYGNVATQTDPSGATWTWERNPAGKILRETSPEGHVVEVEYDVAGREILVTDPAGGRTTIHRDDAGEIEWFSDQNNACVVFERDNKGQEVSMVDRRGAKWTFQYDPHGNCVARIFPNGSAYQFSYDYWGRRTALRSPTGKEARFTYSPSGKLTEFTSYDGRVTRYRYNAMGSEVARVLPDGSTIYSEYGGNDWLCRLVPPDGSQIDVRRNREGWIEYFRNERGERHTYTYELDGLVSEERDFLGNSHRYTHDELGRLLTQDDGHGKHEYKYDRIGQLVEHVAPDGAARTFNYNHRGEVIEAVQENVIMRWSRDPTGEILREEFCFDDMTYVVESERDLGGARVKLRSSAEHEVNIRRDPNGQVIELCADGDQTLRLTRDDEGRVVRRDFSRGGGVITQFDVEGRVHRTDIVTAGESIRNPLEPEWLGEGAPWQHGRQYDYTPVSEVARVTDSQGSFTEYEYDARHHVTSAKHGNATVERFRIDATSNYFEDGPEAPQRVFGQGSQLQVCGDWEYVYNVEGQLQGKRIRLRDGSYGEWWRYDWSGFGFLKSVHRPDGMQVDFEYDAYGRRVLKTVTQDGELVRKTHFVWDLVTLLHEIKYEAGATEPTIRTYLYEDNDTPAPLAHRDGGREASVTHYLTDLNGYPLELLDAAGRVVAHIERRVFGEPMLGPGEKPPTAIRFSGQYADDETGLYYNRYRYYDPITGRYISPDPIGILGGLNLYQYTPNPVGWTDPMGWFHTMDVIDAPEGFNEWASGSSGNALPNSSPPQYQSGRSDKRIAQGARCPDALKTNAGCHTEQKFAHDLMAWDKWDRERGGTGAKNQSFKLRGEFPPCPNCHAALMRAAHETGAKIEYTSADGHSITYDGTSKRPSADHNNPKQKGVDLSFSDGNPLKPTYEQTKLAPGAHSGPTGTPATVGAKPDWGATHGRGAWKAYYGAK